MLGTHGRQMLSEILRAVSEGNGDAVLGCVDKLEEQAPDHAALLNDLAGALQRIAVLQVLPKAADEDDDPALQELAGKVPAEDVQLYYQIVVGGRRDLPYSPDPRLGFEMTLLRLLAFRPGTEGESRSGPVPARQPSAAPVAGAAHAAAAARPPSADTAWPDRVETLGLEGFAKQLARHCEWAGRSGDTVRLGLDPRMKHHLQEDRRAAIEKALSQQLNEKLRVVIELATASAQTPAKLEELRSADRQRAAETSIDTDPAVLALKEKFGATVRSGSVQPIGADK